MDIFTAFLIATASASTPLLLAALGELISERSGVMNLGLEGAMLVGAVAAFATSAQTGDVFAGTAAGMLAGSAWAGIYAFLVLVCFANQISAGIAMTITGIGFSAFVGRAYAGQSLSLATSFEFPAWLKAIPVLGSLHPIVIGAFILVAVVQAVLYRSRVGLLLRAVGDSPENAAAIGYGVIRVRFAAIVLGGVLAGIGGAYLAVVHTGIWTEGITAGRGWIAIALVVFATWQPVRVLLGAYLFGGVSVAQYFAQSAGVGLPSEVMAAIPYVATIAVLVLISRQPHGARLSQPLSLGKPIQHST